MTRPWPWLALAVFACRQSLPAPVLPLTPTPDASFRQSPPALEPLRPVENPVVHAETLENGMTVLVCERPGLPTVSLVYANRSAHEADDPTLFGLAALTARTLNEGTRLSDGRELARLRFGGMRPRILAGFAGTTIRVAALASALEPGVHLLADLVRNPLLYPAGVEAAREQLADQAFGRSLLVREQLRRAAYDALTGGVVAGHGDALRGLTDAMVRQFHREHYGPAESALIAIGAVRAADVVAAARAAFGDWSEKPHAVAQPAAPPASTRRASSTVIQGLMGDGRQAHFALAMPCVGANDAEIVNFDLLAMILANLFGSRAMVALRHEAGIGYAISADCEQRAQDGVFWVEFSVDTPEAGGALAQVLDQIRRLRLEPVSARELEVAKARLHGLAQSEIGDSGDLARGIASRYLLGQAYRGYEAYRAELERVDAAALQRTALRYFDGARLGVAIYGDPTELSAALARFGTIKWWQLE